ncbi:uncharacterized protein LOC101895840 [Musca domestica]|uniref:Uncharacterized protein LOC101895840 n=1 Tax=Musca domestica TaxID=7370 RepID=A0A9J7CTE2_MUSDO|nr:uncharacterized protein LOC101895840 [Musca domestica]
MRSSFVLLCLAAVCLVGGAQAASYKRGDKISEHFKQLDLAPEEIDPNVAPLDSENEVIFDSEIVDQAEEEAVAAAAAITEETPVEEAAQSVATTAAPVTTAAAAAAATEAPVKVEEESQNVLAKYCKCSGNHCDCCRNFNLPFIPVKGPGCARMSYLGNEKMAVSLKYGDLTLITRTVSSRRARPICVGLPGGYSQFCGRIYGLSKASENFKACLGFELRADDEVEAALRVSCFKFGKDGLKVADAEPLPSEAVKQEEDDDDDIFGFGGAGDDDEDDYDDDAEDEEPEDDDDDADTDYADDDDTENDEAPADADYGGFSLAGLLDELDDDEDDDDTKPVAASPATTAPVDATRTADAAQSKDEKGTEAVAQATEMMDDAATMADTVAPATETTTSTVAKTKKAKKAKKNKKKKAAEPEGGDFAYELLNGLLDFFN